MILQIFIYTLRQKRIKIELYYISILYEDYSKFYDHDKYFVFLKFTGIFINLFGYIF